ncbi:MAG: hypothetical protein LAQ30_01645 [Acidobacteriia bacterium]|nr:hypothetical protein [Terriglobia bacterium]
MSYPTTGRFVTLAELNAGWQAAANPPFLTADASNIGQWSGITQVNLSLMAQRDANRASYDEAVASWTPQGYPEPAYAPYQFSVAVPTAAQPYLAPNVAEPGPAEQPRTVEQITQEYDAVAKAEAAAQPLAPATSTQPTATQPTSTQPTSPQPTATQPTSSQTTIVVINPGRLSLSNTSRQNSDYSFQVGDSFLVEITGASPRQPVTVGANRAGSPVSTSQVGSTDASGNFRLMGQMADEHVGFWEEVWKVGGVTTGGVSFAVARPTVMVPVSQQPDSQSTTPTQPTSTTPENSGDSSPTSNPAAAILQTLKDLPWYAWAGTAAVLAFGFSRSKR